MSLETASYWIHCARRFCLDHEPLTRLAVAFRCISQRLLSHPRLPFSRNRLPARSLRNQAPRFNSLRTRDAKIGVSVALVNTPITVRDNKGNMIHTLDAKDFQVTDNGVPQRILHFDMGGDPLSRRRAR